MNGVEDHAVCKHAPVPKWHRLQAVHKVKDVLALHLNGDAELITLSGKRLLSSEKPNVEADTSAMRVMVKMFDNGLRDVADVDARPDRTRVTPATMPGRFLPRTVMTTRLEEVSAMGFLSGHAAMPPKSLQSARPRRRTEDGGAARR